MSGLPGMSVGTWTLDGVSFNTGPNAQGFSYLIKSPKGWTGGPPARPDHTERPTAAGSYRAPNYDGPRVIELDGIAQCATRADRDTLCDTLAGLCRDPNKLYPLVKTEYSRQLVLSVERNAAVDVIELPDGVTVAFNILLIAADPRKFSTTSKSAATGLVQASTEGVYWDGADGLSGTTWDGPAVPTTGVVWQASSGTSGVMTLTNSGTAPAPVVFTITAPASGVLQFPTITDATNGNVLAYSGTMAAGTVMTIDTATGLCLLNGGSIGGLLSRADFFTIPARTTITVQFSAGNAADTAQLSAQWQDTY